MALDDSGNGLNGLLVNRPGLVAGVKGRAVSLNGVNQWVDVGDPVALRLTGSLSISAWINASSFPRDEAAIASDHTGLGYQLDTTIDQGPRTIGFKLADASGRLMARYGRTPLELNRWYHVAGVYDAQARTLHVFLNGRPDDGCLVGHVTDRQHISGPTSLSEGAGANGGTSSLV
jgi:Concanavalin A-like lectin/glucanases superfamily